MLVDELARGRLIRRFGPDVSSWIAGLPALVDRLSREWRLRVERYLPGGTSCTYLCARENGGHVVLKLTPEPGIAIAEHRALRAWNDVPAMVDVLDADLPTGALLLEAIEPGSPVDAPMSGLLDALHLDDGDGFQPLSDRVDFVFSLLRKRTGRDVSPYHRRAKVLARDKVTPKLLHGDLHLGNVLDGGDRGPVAIDPRPCFGDPAYDAIDFVYGGASIESLSGVVDGDRLELWCDALAPFFPTAWRTVSQKGDG